MRRKPQNLTESKQSSGREGDGDEDEGGGTVHRGGNFSALAIPNEYNNRMPRDHRHMMAMWLALLLLLIQTTGAQHESISQISPKSSSQRNDRLSIESTIADSINGLAESQSTLQQDQDQHQDQDNENETRAERVERSASPILHEQHHQQQLGPPGKAHLGPNDVNYREDQQKDVSAGRYFHYNIKPTGTYDGQEEQPEQTQRTRAGKTLTGSSSSGSSSGSSSSRSSSLEQSFLGAGDLRPLTSGSPPIRPSPSPSSTATSGTASSATQAPHSPRQNGNPDIQDIITGIVKLLNGNVNVHANTQGVVRRPSASRINNRGPPRISETQNLPPIDYEAQKPGTSMRPPPYPFDRPERPFITGVPIPEQIVPLRPGFVSNRPPWYRNKPRPPITTSVGGSRRPLPQYKPLPAPQVVPQVAQEPQQQSPALQQPLEDAVLPTDTTYDSEFSNEDANAQYIEVSDQDTDATGGGGEVEDELPPTPPPPPSTSPNPPSTTPTAPKKKHKPKPEKKKQEQQQQQEQQQPVDGLYTTIVETSSVVHTVLGGMSSASSSAYVPMPMDSSEGLDLDPSTEEVIFMTANRTPGLETSPSSALSSSSSSSTTATPLLAIETSSSSSSSTSTTSTSTSTTSTSTTTSEQPPSSTTSSTANTSATPPANPYHPRPGIVLDDPEFKPGGRPRPAAAAAAVQPKPPIQPTRQQLPPGYGEIFDVTLSAIQGPGPKGSGSKQTINIKPYGGYGAGQGPGQAQGQGQGLRQDDIIVSAAGDDGFVSIDGKRTYINLFGDPTDAPAGSGTTAATRLPQLPQLPGSSPGVAASSPPANAVTQSSGGYVVPETEVVDLQGQSQSTGAAGAGAGVGAGAGAATTNAGPTRPHYRQRPTPPPVRIDTCIVGDDSTCDQAQHERCKTDSGVSSCHCRPGYSRRKHREPCRRVISFHLGLRVDRIYEHRIVWDHKLMDRHSEAFGQLSYESIRALDSAMSMTPYSDEFMEAKVNNIYRGDPNLGGNGVYVNMTLKLDESVETLRPNLRSDVQKHLLGVLHRRNNNIGNSVLYVSSPEGAVSPLQDLDECQSPELNDCHPGATCSNTWGSFRCACEAGLRDPWADQPQRAGRECQACLDSYCNNHGSCSYSDEGSQLCTCDSSHYGAQCEIDGEVLGVAIGASVAAIVIIVLTLVCLIMWSRRWQREQKNAMGSPVFGYMNTAPLKSAAGLPQAGYQVTLEDRMRWAQIADVMAQTNHYGAEPIGPTRPSSAMFAYPNLGAMGMGMGMGTLGGMSLQSTMQMHPSASLAPPVPLARLGLGPRSNGMRTLENSSSSEEEDRADLLGRNFQVPRPKSRSNGSIANQSGIYYDVDYEPSGNGIGNSSVDHLYGSQNQSVTHSAGNNHMPGPQGIPMSTYTSGRAPSSYYMK